MKEEPTLTDKRKKDKPFIHDYAAMEETSELACSAAVATREYHDKQRLETISIPLMAAFIGNMEWLKVNAGDQHKERLASHAVEAAKALITELDK